MPYRKALTPNTATPTEALVLRGFMWDGFDRLNEPAERTCIAIMQGNRDLTNREVVARILVRFEENGILGGRHPTPNNPISAPGFGRLYRLTPKGKAFAEQVFELFDFTTEKV